MPAKKKSIDNPVDDPNPSPDVVDEDLDTQNDQVLKPDSVEETNLDTDDDEVLKPDSGEETNLDKDYTVDFVDEHEDDVSEENELAPKESFDQAATNVVAEIEEEAVQVLKQDVKKKVDKVKEEFNKYHIM